MINTGYDFLWGHLLSSAFFLIIGVYYWFRPPKKYEVQPEFNIPSKMTQLNEDTWTESFQYSGKIMSIASSSLLVFGLLMTYIVPTNNLSTNQLHGLNFVSMFITMMVLAVMVSIKTETHMEKIFDKNGNRRKL